MKKQPSHKRFENAERTKTQIYEAAMELVWAQGFEATTIKQIVEGSKVSLGTFYHYFPSKISILEESFKRADQVFEDLLASGLPKGSSRSRILAFVDRYAVMVRDSGLDYDTELYNSRNKFFVQKGRGMQQSLATLIAEAQARGELSQDMSPDALCDYLFIAMRGVVFQWCLLDGKPDIGPMLRAYIDRLLLAFEPRS
jgi:TetR/AcrR family transcriptional regulator, fatty acid metabolism regulator protein